MPVREHRVIRRWLVRSTCAVLLGHGLLACAEPRGTGSPNAILPQGTTAGAGAGAAPTAGGGAAGAQAIGAAGAGTAGAGAAGATATAGSDASGAGAAGAAGSAPGAPTFTAVYNEILVPQCVSACHQAPTFLNFTTRELAYKGLLNQHASSEHDCAGSDMLLVVPSQPEQSLLVHKLRIPAPCGQTMPYGGSLPEEPQHQIEMWIAAGALDN